MAAAENLELRKGAQQPYAELKTELESVFNSSASREARMVEFDNRVQRVDESEDEFMLSLVRLFKAANPDADDGAASLAVKRKFMQGISAELRRSTYIFCSDPFATTVTYQQLLESARKARLQLAPVDQAATTGAAAYVTNVSENCGPTQPDSLIMQAIDGLAQSFNERLDTIETRFNNQLADVNSINNNSNNNNNNNNSQTTKMADTFEIIIVLTTTVISADEGTIEMLTGTGRELLVPRTIITVTVQQLHVTNVVVPTTRHSIVFKKTSIGVCR